MTGRSIQSLRAFPFSPEFEPPGTAIPRPEARGEMVSLPVDELSVLLEHARQETAQLVHKDCDKTLERLQETTIGLQKALQYMLELADHLDRVKMETDDRSRARALMASACQTIIDGQGDLFASLPASTDR
ncbi:MAG: hypothetical protein AAFY34_00950 [Pseudomonadota bacterium]